jgi:dTDP-4-amino-4,6-dideoxygalactose transaminase
VVAVGADTPLPGTEEAARTHLALPMGPLLTEEQVREVIRVLASLP